MSNVRKSIVDIKGINTFLLSSNSKELLVAASTMGAIENKELEEYVIQNEELKDVAVTQSVSPQVEPVPVNPIQEPLPVNNVNEVPAFDINKINQAPTYNNPVDLQLQKPAIDDLNISGFNIPNSNEIAMPEVKKEEALPEVNTVETVIDNKLEESKLDTPQSFEHQEASNIVEEPIYNKQASIPDPYVSFQVNLEKEREALKEKIIELQKKIDVSYDELSREIEKLRETYMSQTRKMSGMQDIKTAINANIEEIRGYSASNGPMLR